MNQIYLPQLKRIIIKNYSLYIKDIDFKFVNGINLILGGNGIGKTTFINILKYALIGLYKSKIDIRTYKGEKKEKRPQYSSSYFKNRMDPSCKENERAEVILYFNVKEVQFKIIRSLYSTEIREVSIKQNTQIKSSQLTGLIISQEKYENVKDDNEKFNYLPYQYEKKIVDLTNFANFDSFIFFVNYILTFDEDRKTIFWDVDKDSQVQEILLGYFLLDPAFIIQRDEAIRNSTYYDSLARHSSEDIKAINKIIEKLNESDNQNEYVKELQKINEQIEELDNDLIKIDSKRIMIEKKLNLFKNDKIKNESIFSEKKQFLYKLKEECFKKIWKKKNKYYDIYLDSIQQNALCPMCNSNIKIARMKFITNSEDCFLCGTKIYTYNEELNKDKINLIEKELSTIEVKVHNYEKEINIHEDELEKLDENYEKSKDKKTNLLFKKRELQRLDDNNEVTDESDNADLTYEAMLGEINRLNRKKKRELKKSKKYKKEADEIVAKMDTERIRITKDLSTYFADYATSFIDLPCELSYNISSDNSYKKIYVPVINNIPRFNSYELSESQKFFIDHSFRMGLLDFFQNGLSFFICETPDASLDVAYEENAAKIYSKFAQKGNTVIITCNLNKSAFLDHLMKRVRNKRYLNLLEFGRVSNIHKKNKELKTIQKSIMENFHGKR